MAEVFLCMGRFLGLTGLAAGGFLGLTGPLAPCDCPTACGGKVVRNTKGERVLRVLKFDGLSGRGLW